MPSAAKPPAFQRSDILQRSLNAGKSLEGLRGFVPAYAECCSGKTKVYIPIQIVGVEIGDCSLSLSVESTTTHNVAPKREFRINPKDFFADKNEIDVYEVYLEKLGLFKKAMKPFTDYGSTVTRKRYAFKAALAETTPELREEIEAEYAEDERKVAALSNHQLQDFFNRMMVVKFFPDAGEGFNPEHEEEYDD